MKRIIGGQNLAGGRHDNKRMTAWWFMFVIGIIVGAILVIVQMAVKEANIARDQVASLPYTNENGAVATTGEASAEAMRQTPSQHNTAMSDGRNALNNLYVRVYMTKENRVERIPLETYVQGVVAGEMPIEFELEALKAQAIAARTYIVRRMALKDDSGMPEAGIGSKADVTDTIDHQVYLSLNQLEKKWPKDKRKANKTKLSEAIEQTRGQIITYDGEPIQAVFFSTSNGYTENSEEYWQQEIPYLRSVDSPWDEAISPRYKETVELTLKQFYSKLGISIEGSKKPSIRILDKTTGNRIGMITIGGATLSGREVREKLELASSQFTWSIEGDSITITTFGYGHGVGMSQWGANGMAKAGHGAEEIIVHYYSGTKVEQASKLSNRL
ncbi:MAG: stage II sporulation protein D [Candidatus Pristimantibacillus sp.]